MLKNRIVEALKNRISEKPEREISQAAAKIENQKRLSTQGISKRSMMQCIRQVPKLIIRTLELGKENPN